MEDSMSINVTGRQFEITPAFREELEHSLQPILADQTIKATSINVVIAREKNRFETTLVVNCKYHVISSEVGEFSAEKSFEAALQKVSAQLKVLKEKIKSHKAQGVSQSECRKAAEESVEND
jgi:ribosomal subunit interface protein